MYFLRKESHKFTDLCENVGVHVISRSISGLFSFHFQHPRSTSSDSSSKIVSFILGFLFAFSPNNCNSALSPSPRFDPNLKLHGHSSIDPAEANEETHSTAYQRLANRSLWVWIEDSAHQWNDGSGRPMEKLRGRLLVPLAGALHYMRYYKRSRCSSSK